MRVDARIAAVLGASLFFASRGCPAQALPFLPAGDTLLRHTLELEADEDRQIPLTMTWPLPTRDVPEEERDTLRSRSLPGSATDAGWFVNGAAQPTRLRVFDQTPRENGEAGVQGGWAAGDYAGGVMRLSYAIKPQDDMHYRADDSYASWRFGNWWVTVGEQERWWGPGWDGSLILSNNARPMPGIALDRAGSRPATGLFSWVGPWRLTMFMDRMEDRRPDYGKALQWGTRITFQPIKGLELGLSRMAQWCGTGRPCGLHTFWDLAIAKSNATINNSGPNADFKAKPGENRIALDLRYHIPTTAITLYWQEDGEVFDSGNYRPRQTLELFGAELASRRFMNGKIRTFVEYAGTTCGELSGNGSVGPDYGCAYEKTIYQAGYRYDGRAIGDAMDRDGRRFTLGTMFEDEGSRFWQLRLRRIELNRGNVAMEHLVEHSVAPVATQLWEASAQVDGGWRSLRYQVGVAADRSVRVDSPGHHLSGSAFLSLSAPW